MTTPLPLRIADELERTHPHEAAATLRAQHKLIGELVEALEDAQSVMKARFQTSGGTYEAITRVLLKAKKAQATKEQQP